MSRSEVVRPDEAPKAAMRAAGVRPAGSHRSVFQLVLSRGGGMTRCFGPLPTREVAEMLRVSARALGLIEPDGASLCEVQRAN